MSKPLVFVVDDDTELTKILEKRFEIFGCDVRSFHQAKDFLQAFAAQRPNLALIDLDLGADVNGFDIIHTLRVDFGSDVPLLILSGNQDHNQIANGLEMGANDYIVKPPMRLDFEETISRYVQTDRLASPTAEIFQPVHVDKKKLKLGFKVSIEEVHPGGMILLSDHLVKKGASFHLHGEHLKAVTPSCDKVFVRVVGSEIKTVADQKKYRLHLEVDPTQEQALKDIRDFLNSKLSERLID